eukprot:4120_1
MTTEKCLTCGAPAHDFKLEEALQCVPPSNILQFGPHKIDAEYREQLLRFHPQYTCEEIVGTFLGFNPYYESQEEWLRQKEAEEQEDEDESSEFEFDDEM